MGLEWRHGKTSCFSVDWNVEEVLIGEEEEGGREKETDSKMIIIGNKDLRG